MDSNSSNGLPVFRYNMMGGKGRIISHNYPENAYWHSISNISRLIMSVLQDRVLFIEDQKSPDITFVKWPPDQGKGLLLLHEWLRNIFKKRIRYHVITVDDEEDRPERMFPINLTDYSIRHAPPSSFSDNKNVMISSLLYPVRYKRLEKLWRGASDTPTKKKFCNFIYRHGAHPPYRGTVLRKKFCQQLMQYKPVDCPSKVLKNMKITLPTEKEKLQFMSQYKFSISFENTEAPFYATEKIASAFAAGTVPIYWGCPEIAEIYNPKSFIHVRDFPSWDACIEHIKEVDQNPELYAAYRAENPQGDLEDVLLPGYTHKEACEQLCDIFEEILEEHRKPVWILTKHRKSKLKRMLKFMWIYAYHLGGAAKLVVLGRLRKVLAH